LSVDRELCLQAGMDDVVTKPIDPDLLIAAVRRWAITTPEEVTSPVLASPPVS
jgi:CheY-like chemotaxis protein